MALHHHELMRFYREFPPAIPHYRTGHPRDTQPSATISPPYDRNTVRLACLTHAASVCPEPGSNSPFENAVNNALFKALLLRAYAVVYLLICIARTQLVYRCILLVALLLLTRSQRIISDVRRKGEYTSASEWMSSRYFLNQPRRRFRRRMSRLLYCNDRESV